jgi:hypothetical protein
MLVRLPSSFKKVYAHTADATLTMERLGFHTNRGATGTVTLALPAASKWKGRVVRFHRLAAFAFRIDPAGSEQFVNTNGALSTAGKYKELGDDGAWLELVSDGTNIFITGTNGTINNQA